MNYKKKNNKQFGKKKKRAEIMYGWTKGAHRSIKVLEQIKKEKINESYKETT